MTFVEETQEVNGSYDSGSDSGPPSPKSRRTESSLTIDAVIHSRNESHLSQSSSSILIRSGNPPTSRPSSVLAVELSPTSSSPHCSTSSGQAQNTHQLLPSPESSIAHGFPSHRPPSIPPETPDPLLNPTETRIFPSIYLDEPVWPLTDPAEAKLLRHFVQNLAIWVSALSSTSRVKSDLHCLPVGSL